MKFITNKKLIWAVALIAGAALAGMGAYSAYTSDDEMAATSNSEVSQTSNAINTATNESAGVLDKLQAWTGSWGFTPFGTSHRGADIALENQMMVGGTEIELKLPHVAIDLGDATTGRITSRCSGTLIAPKVVLSAAHCTDNNIGGALVHINGQAGSKMINAVDMIRHKDYTDPLKKTDILLIILETPATENNIEIQKLDHISIANEIIGKAFGVGNTPNYSASGANIRAHEISITFNKRNWLPVDPIINYLKCKSPDADPYIHLMHCAQVEWKIENNTPINVIPGTCKGDSGGAAIANSSQRQFAITSAGAEFYPASPIAIADIVSRAGLKAKGCLPAYSLFTPLDRAWLDRNIKREKLDEGNCYPNWVDTKPRNSKTGRCDDKPSDSESQNDKISDNGLSDNSTGLNNIPLPKCSAADLRRMALWNREHTTAALTAAAAAEYKRLHTDPWQARYDQEYNRLMSEQSSGGGSSNSSYNLTIIDIRARAAAGAQPAPFVYTGPQGSTIDLSQCIEDVYMNLPSGDDTCTKAYRSWFMFVTINNLSATGFNAGCSEALFSGRQQLGTSREWRSSVWDEFYLFLYNVRGSGYRNASNNTTSSNASTAELTFQPLMTDQTPGRLQGTWIWQINWFSNGQWTSRRCDIPVDIARYPTSTQFHNYVSANCPRP